jgi:LPXTG-motif cell wall-anchored protein
LADKDCKDFSSQAAAQAYLRAHPSDTSGLDAKPGPADHNDQAGGDGIACESNPAPFDRVPVFLTSNGNSGTTATTSVTHQPSALPMTGSFAPQEGAIGGGILLLGAVLVLATRRRFARK